MEVKTIRRNGPIQITAITIAATVAIALARHSQLDAKMRYFSASIVRRGS
jgi:hypothetical protein